jgi:hypothetical protein
MVIFGSIHSLSHDYDISIIPIYLKTKIIPHISITAKLKSVLPYRLINVPLSCGFLRSLLSSVKNLIISDNNDVFNVITPFLLLYLTGFDMSSKIP